jgi:hypothetical protein
MLQIQQLQSAKAPIVRTCPYPVYRLCLAIVKHVHASLSVLQMVRTQPFTTLFSTIYLEPSGVSLGGAATGADLGVAASTYSNENFEN